MRLRVNGSDLIALFSNAEIRRGSRDCLSIHIEIRVVQRLRVPFYHNDTYYEPVIILRDGLSEYQIKRIFRQAYLIARQKMREKRLTPVKTLPPASNVWDIFRTSSGYMFENKQRVAAIFYVKKV